MEKKNKYEIRNDFRAQKKILNLFIINYSRKRITYAQQMGKNEREMYNSYWKHLFSYEICLHFSCSTSSGCHTAIDLVCCTESMSSCRSMSFMLEAFRKSFLFSIYTVVRAIESGRDDRIANSLILL